MAGDVVARRALFGGAITSTFPLRFEVALLFLYSLFTHSFFHGRSFYSFFSIRQCFILTFLGNSQDVSKIRDVPDNQVSNLFCFVDAIVGNFFSLQFHDDLCRNDAFYQLTLRKARS